MYSVKLVYRGPQFEEEYNYVFEMKFTQEYPYHYVRKIVFQEDGHLNMNESLRQLLNHSDYQFVKGHFNLHLNAKKITYIIQTYEPLRRNTKLYKNLASEINDQLHSWGKTITENYWLYDPNDERQWDEIDKKIHNYSKDVFGAKD